MYESQDIANRIKTHAKSKGIRLKQMLSDCKLGINTISQMSKGNDMLSKNLAKIADYLDLSLIHICIIDDQERPIFDAIVAELGDLVEAAMAVRYAKQGHLEEGVE